MRHAELLSAIGEVKAATVTGTFERHCSLRWDGLQPSHAGGRWGARGAFEVLYLGRPPASVIAEAYRHLVDDDLDAPQALAAQVVERRLFRCEVDVPDVLDLRAATVQRELGLTDAHLRSDVGDYGPCHRVAAAAHQLGMNGILAPAATGLGETLAVFTMNLDVARWPTIIDSEMWHGLPPDPRQLRLADDAG